VASRDTRGLYGILRGGFKTVFLHTVCQNRAGLSIQGAHEGYAEGDEGCAKLITVGKDQTKFSRTTIE
jgi:hypothetical protein